MSRCHVIACVGCGKNLRRFRTSCDVGCPARPAAACPAAPRAPPPPCPARPTVAARPAAARPATTATPCASGPRPPEEEGGGAGHPRSPTPPLASTRWRCPAPAAPPAHARRPARLEEEENLRAIRRPPEKEEDPAPPANPVHAVRRARPRSEQKVGEREEEEKGNSRREESKKTGGGGAPPQPLDPAPSAASDVPPTSRYALPSLHGVQCW